MKLPPVTEDLDANGMATGLVYGTGDNTQLEFATDEVACLGDLAVQEGVLIDT